MPANLPTKPQVKLPKAMVCFTNEVNFTPDRQPNIWHHNSGLTGGVDFPILVLPFRSPATAKRALKFWQMTEEERVDKVFEVVDATDEEQYWPLGMFLTESDVLAVLDAKEPPNNDHEHDAVTIEVRSRNIGFAPHDYTKIASRTWVWDYAAEDDFAPTWSAKEIKYAARSSQQKNKEGAQ